MDYVGASNGEQRGGKRARGGWGSLGKVVRRRGLWGGGLDRSGWTRASRPLVSSTPLYSREGETSFASCTITFKFYASTQLETATLTQPKALRAKTGHVVRLKISEAQSWTKEVCANWGWLCNNFAFPYGPHWPPSDWAETDLNHSEKGGWS